MIKCSFYERMVVDGGSLDPYRYRSIDTHSYEFMGHDFLLDECPKVGDGVLLESKSWKVVARRWIFTAWGSANWPYGEQAPRAPYRQWCDLVVVPDEGLFVNEARYPFTPEEIAEDEEG